MRYYLHLFTIVHIHNVSIYIYNISVVLVEAATRSVTGSGRSITCRSIFYQCHLQARNQLKKSPELRTSGHKGISFPKSHWGEEVYHGVQNRALLRTLN